MIIHDLLFYHIFSFLLSYRNPNRSLFFPVMLSLFLCSKVAIFTKAGKFARNQSGMDGFSFFHNTIVITILKNDHESIDKSRSEGSRAFSCRSCPLASLALLGVLIINNNDNSSSFPPIPGSINPNIRFVTRNSPC